MPNKMLEFYLLYDLIWLSFYHCAWYIYYQNNTKRQRANTLTVDKVLYHMIRVVTVWLCVYNLSNEETKIRLLSTFNYGIIYCHYLFLFSLIFFLSSSLSTNRSLGWLDGWLVSFFCMSLMSPPFDIVYQKRCHYS